MTECAEIFLFSLKMTNEAVIAFFQTTSQLFKLVKNLIVTNRFAIVYRMSVSSSAIIKINSLIISCSFTTLYPKIFLWTPTFINECIVQNISGLYI